MPPQSPEPTATGPRHAALTGGTGGFPHVEVLSGETSLGRHRRPESLADATVLRPPTTERIAGGRRATLDLSPRSRRSRTSSRPAARSVSVRPVTSARPAPGRHAVASAPAATGIHRAPRPRAVQTLLRIGRPRQQVLLATLVAVGLFLIVLPIQQRSANTTVNPIAADHAVTTTTKPKAKPQNAAAPATGDQQQQAEPGQAAAPAAPAKQSAPAATGPTAGAAAAPAISAPPTSAAPVILVPDGDGPGQSLRTTSTSTVALTFDDGPDPAHTPELLAMLAKYQVKATFCLVGEQVTAHPQIVRQIAAAGHTLCNHTWDHSLTIGKDQPDKIRADLARTNAAIRAAVPDAEIPFFRAPGGNFTDTLVQTAYTDGMISLYWQVDPADWDHPKDEKDDEHVARVIASVQKHTRAGSIVLSHDFAQPDTIKAYETLIPWLKDRFTLGLPSVPPVPSATPSAPAAAPVTPSATAGSSPAS